MRRIAKFAAAAVTAAAVLLPASSAFADDCYNASRPPAPGTAAFQVTGNWIWLPDADLPPGYGTFPQGGVWGFIPPPNFMNSNGAESHLLGNSPVCGSGLLARQTTQGIQDYCTTGL